MSSKYKRVTHWVVPGVVEHRRVGGVVSDKHRKYLINDFLLNHAPLVRLMLARGHLQPRRIVILIRMLDYIIIRRFISESEVFLQREYQVGNFRWGQNFTVFMASQKLYGCKCWFFYKYHILSPPLKPCNIYIQKKRTMTIIIKRDISLYRRRAKKYNTGSY